MTHVGIERLAAGEREKHGADHDGGDLRIRGKEASRFDGIDGGENGRRHEDIGSAESANDDEPHHHDGSE